MIIERLRGFYEKSKVTFTFLAIMVVYFIFMTVNGGTTDIQTLIKYGAMFPPLVSEYNQYYRFITSIFIHIGIMHIFFNGYALYVFGPQIEKLMGPKKYFLFFILTGIAGNIATYIFNYVSVSAGASGSLFGLFGAFLYLVVRHPQMVTPAGKKSILQLLGINLLLTFLIPSISITAHLGGLIIGFLLSFVFIRVKTTMPR